MTYFKRGAYRGVIRAAGAYWEPNPPKWHIYERMDESGRHVALCGYARALPEHVSTAATKPRKSTCSKCLDRLPPAPPGA